MPCNGEKETDFVQLRKFKIWKFTVSEHRKMFKKKENGCELWINCLEQRAVRSLEEGKGEWLRVVLTDKAVRFWGVGCGFVLFVYLEIMPPVSRREGEY